MATTNTDAATAPKNGSLTGIRFAPLRVPRDRRLQTLAVFVWTLILPLSIGLFFFLCSVPLFWPIVITYVIWVAFDQAPVRSGRKSEWVRRLSFFKYYAGYYPAKLIKTVDLPPTERYIFGYHPHGIIGMGALANFATNATGFADLFPEIDVRLLTLQSNFMIPFYRDVLMAMGICSVSMKSCVNILSRGPGKAITIVVGGATESLSAHPGTADLTLKRRLGFIKLAIKQGAHLVPVFSFGENDIFMQLASSDGSKVHRLQKSFQALFGFTLPFFFGRGIFNYNVGLMPYRHPIVSVVGKPIKVEQTDSPTMEQIELVQEQYIAELQRIWDDHKDEYATNRRKEMTIVA